MGWTWVKRILIAIPITIALAFVAMLWVWHEAWGPKYRTVKIEQGDGAMLVCNETYDADMAAVFYTVDFVLKIKNSQSYNLGNNTFDYDGWEKDIQLSKIGDWYVLPVDDYGTEKLLMANTLNNVTKEIVLSPDSLPYDSLWKTKNVLPDWPSGNSKLVSISDKQLKVVYQYRTGNYTNPDIYKQEVQYKIDNTTGDLITLSILEPKKNKTSQP